jgi:5-methylcytosine-specific restriction protein A
VSKHSHLYNNHAWRKRRAAQLAEHPLCKLCMDLRGRVTPATVADHVVPHRGDPVLFEGPLMSLCATCHSSTKQEIEATGRMRGCDVNGYPLDPLHPWNTPGGA